MANKLLLLICVYFGSGTIAQHSPYSLQDAVEALRRREAQLALRDNFNEPPSSHFLPPPPPDDEEYWSQEPVAPPSLRMNRHQLNKLLARYLTRDEDERDFEGGLGPYETDFDDDNNFLQEERKRSFFRERGGKYEPPYASVFRERELAPYETPELTEEFLREIEEEKDLEREMKYKELIRKLWEKYEQQENEIKQDLFDEDEKKKRQLLPYLSPSMAKKRSYPVLPWLPASRKKRFPISKRSPRASNEASIGASGTDEKVARDLEAIFNEPLEEKKKRSAGNAEPSAVPETQQKSNNNEHIKGSPPNTHNAHAQSHGRHEGQNHDDSESEEQDHERDHEHDHDHARDHDHDEDEEDDHDFDDEEDEDRKKKREIMAKKRSTQEVVREDQIIPGDLSDFKKKKSVDWSKYFGMNRRKKSDDWFMKNNNEVKKRSANEDEDKRKKNTDQLKIDNMDRKLKTIEDLIVDETVKYTGAHEGISDPEEIRELKDHVVSRLATAYSLEKMRRALDKLRQSVDNENHLVRNEIEGEGDSRIDEKEKEKRVAVKKEKVDFDNNQHSVEPQSAEKTHELPANELEENDDDKKKKKKKRNGSLGHRYTQFDLGDFEDESGAGHFEPRLNDGYLGNRNNYNYASEGSMCPILDTMSERCQGVDILSGDIHQELLPICGAHQLCYLCGTSQTNCDFRFLAEADTICGHDNDCLSAARATLMILRGTPGRQLGPKECMRNDCLYRAMKEIGL